MRSHYQYEVKGTLVDIYKSVPPGAFQVGTKQHPEFKLRDCGLDGSNDKKNSAIRREVTRPRANKYRSLGLFP
jgi:hypothetical protein